MLSQLANLRCGWSEQNLNTFLLIPPTDALHPLYLKKKMILFCDKPSGRTQIVDQLLDLHSNSNYDFVITFEIFLRFPVALAARKVIIKGIKILSTSKYSKHELA